MTYPGIPAAIELLVNQAGEIGFNSYTILNLHALLSDNLLEDSRACGRLRSIPVGIGGSVFHPLEIPWPIQECFQQILDKAAAVAFIKRQAEKTISIKDQAKFIEAVETEIMNLHEGNIARYSLKPSQYLAWRKKWH